MTPPKHKLLTTKEVATLLGVTHTYLRQYRRRLHRRGLRFVRLSNNAIRYRSTDVQAYLATKPPAAPISPEGHHFT